MLVRAKTVVYYNDKRYREGQIFELIERKGVRKFKDEKGEEIVLSAKDQFSERSMEAVDEDGRSIEGPKKEAKKKEGIVEKVQKKEAKKVAKKEEPKESSSDEDVI